MNHCWLRFRFHKWLTVAIISMHRITMQRCSECGKERFLE